jgi:hypothetical protein
MQRNIMLIPTERIQDLNRINIETSLALATLSMDCSARVFQHHIEFAKGALQEGSAGVAKRLLDRAVEPTEFTANCHERLQGLLDLSKNCLEITLQTQAEMARMVKNGVETLVQAAGQVPVPVSALATTGDAPREAKEVGASKQRKTA